MSVDTVITGGTLVTSDQMVEEDIAIDDGKISAVGDKTSFSDATKEIDASGLLVMPGVVDPHVHLDGYFSTESYEAATSAAALGGVTSCIHFAIGADKPLLDEVKRKKENGEDSLIDFGLHGSVVNEDPKVFDAFDDLIEEGITSIKMFTAYEIGISNGFLDRTFEHIADHDMVAVLHTEDVSVCDQQTKKLKKDSKGDPKYYPQGRPDYAEEMAAENAVRMAQEAGAKYYGIHTTNKKSADVLDSYHTDGSEVRGETCTHYTILDETAYEEQGGHPILAPPLRTSDDQDALFDQLHNGVLSIVSTDHVAFSRADKEVENWWDSPFGANSLQRSLSVFQDEAVNKRNFSYPFVVRIMCKNPAQTFGLSEKGTLEPGTDADIILFDPNERHTISATDNASVADYSIYEGQEVTGQVKKTYVRGELIAEDGNVMDKPGHGEFIHRTVPDWG